MSYGGSQTLVDGKTHYERNKADYIERKKHRKVAIRKFLRRVKVLFGCKDCGIKDWRVLDFDHLNNKKFNISQAVSRGMSIKTLRQEIKKCEVVCANCHRIRTRTREAA